MRGTGKTRAMLERVLAMRANAEQLPVLIYGATWEHASFLADEFDRLARECGVRRVDRCAYAVVLDGTDRFEFRSGEENSPPGRDYTDIAVDHFALERGDWDDFGGA
jgi:hypothetical protein